MALPNEESGTSGQPLDQKKKEDQSQMMPPSLFGTPTIQAGTSSATAVAAYQAFAQITWQKEPNPQVEKTRIEALSRLGDQFHAQTMEQLSQRARETEHLAEIQKGNDNRDFTLAGVSLLVVIGIIVVGVILIFQGKIAEGVGILSGGVGLVFGYLAGYGQGVKKRTF